MSAIPLYTVDAFADGPFQGNPAAVALFDQAPEATLMARIASEMNLAETAFVWPEKGAYGLRWFTPTVEVPLCGHATLAAAHVLLRERGGDSPVEFQTKSGLLRCVDDGDRLVLDLPEQPCQPWTVPQELVTALGIKLTVDSCFSDEGKNALLRLPDGASIESFSPDFSKLSAINIENMLGVMVTVRGNGDPYDFHSRYFAPWAGINEDPVTGSAHCTLAPYWAGILGRESFCARQNSARGGSLWVSRKLPGRVEIAGSAITVVRGEIEI